VRQTIPPACARAGRFACSAAAAEREQLSAQLRRLLRDVRLHAEDTRAASQPYRAGINLSRQALAIQRPDVLWVVRPGMIGCETWRHSSLERKLLGSLGLCVRMAAGGEAVSCEGVGAVYSNTLSSQTSK
jgi:hypothetical protein